VTNPRALAARMAGKPLDYASVPGGNPMGGLSGNDIAGALAMGGASNAEAMMVRLCWVQDKSVQGPLFYELYSRVAGLAVKKGWKPPKGKELLRSMTMLAIAEVSDPGLCQCCGGRREVWPKGATVPIICPECKGVGRRGMREKDRAHACGVAASTWSTNWGPKYAQVLEMVSGVESAGVYALFKGVDGRDSEDVTLT